MELTQYFSKNIEGKRIVITGGTTGIGKAIADLLVSLGGRVFIFGRDKNDFRDAIKKSAPITKKASSTAARPTSQTLKTAVACSNRSKAAWAASTC